MACPEYVDSLQCAFGISKKNTYALHFLKFICQVLFWLAEVSLQCRGII